MFNRLSPVLIRASSVFIIVFILGAVVVTISQIYVDDIYQQQQSAKRNMWQWQSKINSSVENNQIIDAFESNFLKLINQGVVGAEDRLSWFETIQNTAKRRGMPSVKYSISTQTILKQKNITRQYHGIDVFKSAMTLDIKMGHEGDLFVLLNDLEKAGGLFTVDHCDIEKMAKKTVDSENIMKAYCELGWYTFRATKAKKGGRNAS